MDLFEKHVALRNKDITGNRYYEHIKKQSSWVTIGLLVPILGNLGYIFYRIVVFFKNKKEPVEIEVLQENISEPIIEEIGEEESRKIGVGNAGIFSSIMGNFLMAPIQRSMRYRLTFQEFLKNAMEHQEKFPLMYAATERRLQALVLLCAMLNLLHPSN